MAEGNSGSAPTTEHTADPSTIVGLIFRVLDRPSRTLCLLAILALTLAGISTFLHAPPIAHLPVSLWGAMISGGSFTSIGTQQVIRHLRKRKQNRRTA